MVANTFALSWRVALPDCDVAMPCQCHGPSWCVRVHHGSAMTRHGMPRHCHGNATYPAPLILTEAKHYNVKVSSIYLLSVRHPSLPSSFPATCCCDKGDDRLGTVVRTYVRTYMYVQLIITSTGLRLRHPLRSAKRAAKTHRNDQSNGRCQHPRRLPT